MSEKAKKPLTPAEQQYAVYFSSWRPQTEPNAKLSQVATAAQVADWYDGKQPIPDSLRTVAQRWINESAQAGNLPVEITGILPKYWRGKAQGTRNTIDITAAGVIQHLAHFSSAEKRYIAKRQEPNLDSLPKAEQYQVVRAQELGLPFGTGKRYSEQDLERFIASGKGVKARKAQSEREEKRKQQKALDQEISSPDNEDPRAATRWYVKGMLRGYYLSTFKELYDAKVDVDQPEMRMAIISMILHRIALTAYHPNPNFRMNFDEALGAKSPVEWFDMQLSILAEGVGELDAIPEDENIPTDPQRVKIHTDRWETIFRNIAKLQKLHDPDHVTDVAIKMRDFKVEEGEELPDLPRREEHTESVETQESSSKLREEQQKFVEEALQDRKRSAGLSDKDRSLLHMYFVSGADQTMLLHRLAVIFDMPEETLQEQAMTLFHQLQQPILEEQASSPTIPRRQEWKLTPVLYEPQIRLLVQFLHNTDVSTLEQLGITLRDDDKKIITAMHDWFVEHPTRGRIGEKTAASLQRRIQVFYSDLEGALLANTDPDAQLLLQYLVTVDLENDEKLFTAIAQEAGKSTVQK